AQDLTQTILMKLLDVMQSFAYDPRQRFRGWLKTVTHNAWVDLVRARRPAAAGGPPGALSDPIGSAEARAELILGVESAYEWEILSSAMDRGRLRVQPSTWEAFRLMAMEQIDGPEVAARLGMRLASVYKARSNVQRLLRDEIEDLEGGRL